MYASKTSQRTTVRSLLALLGGVGIVASMVGAPAATAATSGYWKLTGTKIFLDTGYPKGIQPSETLDGSGGNDNRAYTWETSGELGDVNVTEEYGPEYNRMQYSADYSWSAPPAKATPGQKWPTSMKNEVVLGAWTLAGNPHGKMIYRFDHIDILPGASSGADWPGVGIGGWDGARTWTGTLVFPTIEWSNSWGADKGRMRLQLGPRVSPSSTCTHGPRRRPPSSA